MAIDFPNSPTSGDLYTAGGKTWQWNGTFWSAYGTSPVYRVSDTPPIGPSTGDTWYESDTGRLYIYTDSYWVEIGSAGRVTVSANDLTGPTLASNVVSSSLTSVGTLGSLTVAGATTSGSFIQGTDYLSPYQGFRNTIINGDFRINQRGLNSTGTTTSALYGFDRWVVAHVGGTCTQSAQTFTVGSPAVAGYESENYLQFVTASQSGVLHFAKVRQFIEDVRTFANSTVTVSFWAKATSGTPKVAIELNQSFGTGGSPSAEVNVYGGQVTLSTSWARYSVTVAVPSISGKTIGTAANTSALIVDFWTSAGSTYNARSGSLGIQNNTFHFWGVQVERGSIATPFEQRPIGTELALCQRYYYRITSPSTFGTVGSGVGSLVGPNGNVDAIFPLPVPMRVAPTSIGYSTLRLTDYQAGYAIASITLATIRTTPTLVQAVVSSTSAMTLYRPYYIESNNSTSGYFEATAEL